MQQMRWICVCEGFHAIATVPFLFKGLAVNATKELHWIVGVVLHATCEIDLCVQVFMHQIMEC